MRRCLVLLLVPVFLVADESAAKPNKLTADEVRRGWLLLFDGETTFGWTVEGEAKVEGGALVLGGTMKTVATATSQFGNRAVSFEADWQGTNAGGEKPKFRVDDGSTGFFETKAKTYRGSRSASPRTPAAGLTLEVPAGCQVRVWNVKLLPLGELPDDGRGFDFGGGRDQKQLLAPIYTGKDLSGWKVFQGDAKREKSKWSVTKEGWLNVKDGPGDLQTEKTFDDFVLQLECRSNGKHLNSGVFFRCVPGKYQQGYEVQVRNQFTEKPTQTYTVEEYDPTTHALKDKRTVTSTAFDYGTGAIYRRVPARKAVAKDGEWFTLTLVANKRHIATWVNGVQQVDWTDNRPAKNNARDGYREEAGAISIQGHDPTTDLTFRNLRVGSLR